MADHFAELPELLGTVDLGRKGRLEKESRRNKMKFIAYQIYVQRSSRDKKSGHCHCPLDGCLFSAEEEDTIKGGEGAHVTSRLTTRSDRPGCAEHGGHWWGQRLENIRNTDSEPG